jgi:hypothetical protein
MRILVLLFPRMLLGTQYQNSQNINIDDPVCDEFYELFRQIARNNARIYEEVFSTLPSDQVRRFDHVSAYTETPKLKDTNPELVKKTDLLMTMNFECVLFLVTREIKRRSRLCC